MEKTIAVLCPWGLDTGLLSKAVSMADNVHVLVPESDASDAARFGGQVIHTLLKAPEDEGLLAEWLANKTLVWGSNVILAPATIRMRNVMPMLAYRLKAGLTADCTELSLDGDNLVQTRPAFGNSLMAKIHSLSTVQMATVRPGTFRSVETPSAEPVVIKEDYAEAGSLIGRPTFRSFEDGVPLGQADIIVAGGAGIGSREGFQKLEFLAGKLGGSLAASRNAVDAGYAPYRYQVGMTGVTVCPKLYIAVGISGAVQHLAGMSGAEKVIAINSDPKAPIFDYADYGIVSDWESVVDRLLEESI